MLNALIGLIINLRAYEQIIVRISQERVELTKFIKQTEAAIGSVH